MNRLRFGYCLLGWLACLAASAAEPPAIRYDGYEERHIKVYFSYAGDGTGRIDQPPPADLEEKGLALFFHTRTDTGPLESAWIWPKTYYLGYFVATKKIDGERFAIFQGTGAVSTYGIALNREDRLWVQTGYFGRDDRGDSLVKASEGDVFRLNGIDYAVRKLSRSEAVLREVKTEREMTLPLSPLGEMRRENLKLRREMEELRRDYWIWMYSESTPMLIGCGAMLFFFLMCYACIVFGLATLDDYGTKRKKSYRPPQERR
jgi:hypothetical protein